GRAARPPAAAPAPRADVFFTAASAPGGEAAGDDPLAELVDEHTAETPDLAALAAGASGPLPAPPAAEMPTAPDPAEVEQLVRGNGGVVDLGTVAVPVEVAEVATSCPTLRVAGATIDCQGLAAPEAAAPAAPDVSGGVADATEVTGVVRSAVAEAGNTRAPAG
ncbi:MAG: hypothetical protein M3Q48_17850, partial [Actinomycetota bacterium]|nr:hypothetical protein [Actinomycetota bacterium]